MVSLFGQQGQLESLPVPDLKSTLGQYLTSVECLLSAEDFAETKRKVEEFGKAGGVGERLHKLLIERSLGLGKSRSGAGNGGPLAHPDGSPYPDNHWLERWWETYAYLSDRTSLAVNINCFQTHFGTKPCDKPLLRGAWSIKGGLDARRLLQNDAIPAERAGKKTMCSAQYCRVFGTTRVPGLEVDEMQSFPNSKHICIQRRGYWYVMDDVDTLSVEDIYKNLEYIVKDAEGRPQGPDVGVLTSQSRDKWAADRAYLRQLNAVQVDCLESAVFHVVLSLESPKTPDELQRVGQCGSGEIWFDKSSTHIICENGAVVSNLEHAAADAVVPARIYVYMDEFTECNADKGIGCTPGVPFGKGLSGIPVTTGVTFGPENKHRSLPSLLSFNIDSKTSQAIAVARQTYAALVNDNMVTCLDFRAFGSRTIAEKCKGVSADSFAQMSLALAFYRDQSGAIPVSYETASTRGFFHGRTETIRPQSVHMRDFLQAFDDPHVERKKVAESLRRACSYHRNYLRRCMAGRGVDRHLFGLRVLASEQGLETPEMFDDIAYKKSTCFTLSTSQMPWGVEDWPGFGAYDPAAYGVCYRFTHTNGIIATITCRGSASGNGKDAIRFSKQVARAFEDILEIVSSNPAPPRSKL